MFPVMMILVMGICLVTFLVFGKGFMHRHGPGHGFRGEDRGGSSAESPLEIAKRRYALGEITKEEFEEITRTIS